MATQKLTFIRGDDQTLNLTFTDGTNPVNLTGSKVYFTVKKQLTDLDAAALIQKTVTSHTNPTNGLTLISLSNLETNLTPGTYYWDLQLKNASGGISSTTYGLVEIIYDVTQTTT